MAGQYALAVFRLVHLDSAQMIQTLHERTRKTGGHMLGNQYGRTIGGHGFEHLPDRFRAAGRSPDKHQLFGR